ncbi:hypothetical protein F9278_01655 [Streptomyces phaeolivaceus]|uniref:Uncharacterized protein n=1 Tax=Streptomyces phaeolivaceus TaxID=2653200 RepID=A0A5P8JW80_9ACTN|nr:hypothetical protein [Streptomyces phaeolivaceus]QFQ95111.1 hypothetical protein F9278_01655 [Streptomyces phaeolivaceus]
MPRPPMAVVGGVPPVSSSAVIRSAGPGVKCTCPPGSGTTVSPDAAVPSGPAVSREAVGMPVSRLSQAAAPAGSGVSTTNPARSWSPR